MKEDVVIYYFKMRRDITDTDLELLFSDYFDNTNRSHIMKFLNGLENNNYIYTFRLYDGATIEIFYYLKHNPQHRFCNWKYFLKT